MYAICISKQRSKLALHLLIVIRIIVKHITFLVSHHGMKAHSGNQSQSLLVRDRWDQCPEKEDVAQEESQEESPKEVSVGPNDGKGSRVGSSSAPRPDSGDAGRGAH